MKKSKNTSSRVTKRDYFAGLAMQAIVGDINVSMVMQEDSRFKRQPDGRWNFSEVVALNAYEFADAMLTQSGRRAKGKRK